MRHSKLGESRRLATESRPDIGARLAKIASLIGPLRGSDVYRSNDPVRAVMAKSEGVDVKHWKALDFTVKAADFTGAMGGGGAL